MACDSWQLPPLILAKKYAKAIADDHSLKEFEGLCELTEKAVSICVSEFKAKIVQEFMKSMKILHTFSYSIRKACIVERFNQTIEGKVAREVAG